MGHFSLHICFINNTKTLTLKRIHDQDIDDNYWTTSIVHEIIRLFSFNLLWKLFLDWDCLSKWIDNLIWLLSVIYNGRVGVLCVILKYDTTKLRNTLCYHLYWQCVVLLLLLWYWKKGGWYVIDIHLSTLHKEGKLHKFICCIILVSTEHHLLCCTLPEAQPMAWEWILVRCPRRHHGTQIRGLWPDL